MPFSHEGKAMFTLLDRYRLPDSPDHLAWNSQGNKLVVGSWPERRSWGQKGYDAFTAVLELKGGRLRQTHQFKLNPRAKGDDVVAFSPDDRYVAVGNTTVELFDLQENRSVWVSVGNVGDDPNAITVHKALAFTGDGQLSSFAAGPSGRDLNLQWGSFGLIDGTYTRHNRTKVFIFPQFAASPVGARWSVTPEMTTREVRPLRVWIVVRELASGKEVTRLEPQNPPGADLLPTALSLSRDGRYLAIGGQRGLDRDDGTGVPPDRSDASKTIFSFTFPYLQIWDLAKNRLLHEHLKNDCRANDAGPLPSCAAIRSLDFSPDGRWLLMRQGDTKNPDVHLLDVTSGQRVWSLDHNVGYGFCRFSPSGDTFACSGYREVLVYKKHH